MKIFAKDYENYIYFIYRVISPIFDPIRFFTGITGYFWFIRDLIIYKIMDRKSKISMINIFPVLHEKSDYTPFDTHYFHQQIWAFEKVLQSKVKDHYDIGSTYVLSGYLSKICKANFLDLRPIDTQLNNLNLIRGDITHLPFKDSSIASLSCLHVVEHIGLGRYGDVIDPSGSKKAIKELERVLAKNGKLYFSVPVGKERLCFNAHRIFNPKHILGTFNKLKLVSFSFVDDHGKLISNVDISKASKSNYACGLFEFTK